MSEKREQRSRIMRAVKSRDTGPEMLVRRFIHAAGLRYRLHDSRLPGTPDLVFPNKRIVLFVNGCFWHQHSNCPRASRPRSNVEYWSRKLDENIHRDIRHQEELKSLGWHVIVVWECQIRDRSVLQRVVDFIRQKNVK